MVAIHLPDHRETAWLLVPPLIWEKITRQLQGLREPRQEKERAPGVATPIPDVLPPQILQQAEEHLARLVEMPEVRTAFLLNPHGRVSACKGPDTQEALQRYSDSRNDLSGPTSLTNEQFDDTASGLIKGVSPRASPGATAAQLAAIPL